MKTEESTRSGDSLRRVADHWDRTATSRQAAAARGWLDSYYVASRRLSQKVSGSPDVNWLLGLVRRLGISSDSLWLSIGSGSAEQEIALAREGLVARLDAVDISPASLEAARRRAAAEGVECIRFRQADFYRLDLEPESYDVVLMNMSLHHVEDLDAVLASVVRCLRPDGYFLINEYVGPRQFQFTDRQLAIVASLLQALPAQLREDAVSGEIKCSYERRTVDFWNDVDPSESIRSDLILPKCHQYFHVREQLDYGGTILHLLLEHIVQNFDHGRDDHRALLDLLFVFEDLLIEYDVLRSDFTVMAMQKRAEPLADLRVPVPGSTGGRGAHEVEFLHRELEKARARIRAMETSRGWRALQWLRGLVGRRW